ncbi:hypothetical protein GCM10010517_66380 [Streptosporangium fragile]|uniref:Uncharacterized protein n=1 Tax=Streptosporangium fragile TaxID=46186 RepID=A0ABN3W746_9ACTN
MFAAAETLLLGRGDHLSVDDESGRWIVEDRVDPEKSHELTSPPIPSDYREKRFSNKEIGYNPS